MEHDKILITSGKGEYACRKDSSTKEVFENYKVIIHEDLEQYGEYYCKDSMGTLTPFVKIKNQICVAKSHIYKNIFYPIQDFDKLFREDLFSVMTAISSRLGAKSIEFSYHSKKDTSTTKEKKIAGRIDLFLKVGDIKADCQQNNRQENFDSDEWREYDKQENLKDRRWSKDELKEYISKNNIVIDVLPPRFREKLKRYLDDGEISGNLEKEENMESFVQINCRENQELMAKIGAKKIVGVNLQFNHDTQMYKDSSFTSKIKYRIEF